MYTHLTQRGTIWQKNKIKKQVLKKRSNNLKQLSLNLKPSSAASDVYKRQGQKQLNEAEQRIQILLSENSDAQLSEFSIDNNE